MTLILEGKPIGKRRRIAIIGSRFNEAITTRLLRGAMGSLIRSGVSKDKILVVWVPGAFEIPWMAQQLLQSKKCDGIIALGAVIRGETAHFDYVCQGLVDGMMNVELKFQAPISFGVLTTDTERQALERSGGKHGNKGEEAAEVLLRVLDLRDRIQRKK